MRTVAAFTSSPAAEASQMRVEQFESSGHTHRVGSLPVSVVVTTLSYFITTEILYYVTRSHSSSPSLLLIIKKKIVWPHWGSP